MATEIADSREKMLADARGEAEALRRELKQKAREETERIRTQWHESFRQQKDAFEQGFRLHACRQVSAAVRRALADMADMELETRMIEVFIRRIRDLDPVVRKEIAKYIMGAGGAIVVRSAFEINAEGKRKIIEAIGEQIGKNARNQKEDFLHTEVKVNFETSESLICGLEIVANGRKVEWDLEGYLDELEQGLTRDFENGTAGSSAK
jgi:F-type H+-transporting ATPase subunit b